MKNPLIFFGQRGAKSQPRRRKSIQFFENLLTFLLAGKFSEWAKLFSDFTNHLHLHPSIFLMATFLRLCTKLFSEQQKSLPSVSRKGLVTPYEARMRKQKTPHDNKTDYSVSFFIRCLGSLIRTMPDTLSLSADVQLNAAPLTRYKDHYSVVWVL